MPGTLATLAGHRLELYGIFSTMLVSAVVASAFHKHSNFYSATVYLSRSSASVMVLANYGVLLTLFFGRFVQKVFFGPLSNQEVERLYDRTWYFLTESLLAFTIFRDEFDAPFVIMFGALLFIKCFHWLIADRVDWMDQQPYPGPSWLFHIRTNTMFLLLWAIDLLMLDFAVQSVLDHGVGGIVLFGSEYAILLASCWNSIAKYYIMVYDLRRARNHGGEDAPVWENKSMYMFYIELVTDFLKLTIYLGFFAIVMAYFGLPLNIIRDVYLTGASFYTRFRDLLRYRAATKDMETKYPDATPAELEAMSDRTCIICREEMIITRTNAQLQEQQAEPQVGPNGLRLPAQTLGLSDPPKKLHCGHVFHFQCLRSWLERQQSCPTCRRSVLETDETPATNDGQAQAPAPAPAPGAAPAPPVPAPTPNDGRPPNTNQAQPTAGVHGLTPTPTTNASVGGQASRPAPPAPRTFQGFQVAGQWHTWPIDPASHETDAATGSSSQPIDTGSSAEASIPTSTPTTTTTAPALNSEHSHVSSSAPPSQSALSTPAQTPALEPLPDETLSPREAAARAALRRFGSSSSRVSRTVTLSSPSEPAPSRDATPTPHNRASIITTEPSLIPSSTSGPLLTEIPPPISSAAASTSSVPSSKVTYPTLIPLFDPSSVAHRPFVNLNGLSGLSDLQSIPSVGATPLMTPLFTSGPTPLYTGASSSAVNASASFPWYAPPTTMSARSTPFRTPIPSSTNIPAMLASAMADPSIPSSIPLPSASSASLASNQPSSTLQRQPSLTQIPSILADEAQLRALDTWSREAIDERLRVLEDVQRTLWKASEDLQRMRSMVPPNTLSTGTVESESIVEPEDSKGKGKAKAVVQEESQGQTSLPPLEEDDGEEWGLELDTNPSSYASLADIGRPMREDDDTNPTSQAS